LAEEKMPSVVIVDPKHSRAMPLRALYDL